VVAAHELADGVREGLHVCDAGCGLKVEQRTHVQTAGGRMPGERGASAAARDESLELGDEVGKTLRRDGRVLDERGRPLGARRAHEERQRRAPQGGRLGERRAVGQHDRPDGAELAGDGLEARETGARLLLVALVLDGQHRLFVPLDERRHQPVAGQLRRCPQRRQVEQFHRRRACLEDDDVRVQGGAQRGERERRADAARRPRVELDLEFGGQRQRTLRTRQKTGEVGRRLQQLTQVVPGRTPPRLRRGGGDRRPPPLADLAERGLQT